MSDKVQENLQTTQQILQTDAVNESSPISCMSLPRVLLSRIDISNLSLPVVRERKMGVESLLLKKKSIKKPQNAKSSTKQHSKVGRPRKIKPNNSVAKSTKKKVVSPVKNPRGRPRSQKGSVKIMLGKTALINKNIVFEKQKKKTKKKTKQSSVKNISIPKPKNINIKNKITKDDDSSEDEFLYDELIEDLEKFAPSKGTVSAIAVAQKKNNIMLQPSSGNKAPTIVRGGIVKRAKLPSELQSVSSSATKTSNTAKGMSGTVSIQQKRLVKRGFPWSSISMSNGTKIYKKHIDEMSSTHTLSDLKPPSPLKPRIGPKQILKVGPLFNASIEDNNSDEYTEIETLENEDFNDDKTNANNQIPPKSILASSSKDCNDPNIDLIRILSDDTDYQPVTHELYHNSKINLGNKVCNVQKAQNAPISEDKPIKEDAPPVRTIYDLMNKISMEHPSWNLHIVPETNAFCIAQVTKGRLGIPTMKKCIELDSYNFFARVYIHQYHIKKYDGVYDSEESILALFQEIHSIKS